MLIQRCKNCSNQFKRRTIMGAIVNGYEPIKCDNCGTKNYFNFVYRLTNAVLFVLPIVFKKTLYNLFDVFTIFVYFIWFFIVLYISPLYARYHIKNR